MQEKHVYMINYILAKPISSDLILSKPIINIPVHLEKHDYMRNFFLIE